MIVGKVLIGLQRGFIGLCLLVTIASCENTPHSTPVVQNGTASDNSRNFTRPVNEKHIGPFLIGLERQEPYVVLILGAHIVMHPAPDWVSTDHFEDMEETLGLKVHNRSVFHLRPEQQSLLNWQQSLNVVILNDFTFPVANYAHLVLSPTGTVGDGCVKGASRYWVSAFEDNAASIGFVCGQIDPNSLAFQLVGSRSLSEVAWTANIGNDAVLITRVWRNDAFDIGRRAAWSPPHNELVAEEKIMQQTDILRLEALTGWRRRAVENEILRQNSVTAQLRLN